MVDEDDHAHITAAGLSGRDAPDAAIVEPMVVRSIARSLSADADSVVSIINNLDACAQYCQRLKLITIEEAQADFVGGAEPSSTQSE